MTTGLGGPPTAATAQQLYDDGLAAFRRGDNDECRRLNERAIEVAVEAGAAREEGLGHIGLARADFREAKYADGLAHAQRADELASTAGDHGLHVLSLHLRAEMKRAQGAYAEAVPLYEELLAIDEADGNQRALAMEHYNFGSVLVQTGDLGSARVHLSTALDLQLAGGFNLLGYVLLGFAGLLAREGDVTKAAKVLGAVEAHFARIGEVLDPGEALELASHVAAASAKDPAAYAAAYDEGAKLSLDEARLLVG